MLRPADRRPPLAFWQIVNMSVGFLGIQFGWGLQMANMSAIYEQLGASPDALPLLWLAAPLTGLIVQPIIGHMSDRTWGRLGRRRPYFLIGALLASLALILMPNSPELWIAAGLLWILDASINVSMEPFRAFVADLLPNYQRTQGFAMQSLMIGLGACIASALPWVLTNLFDLQADTHGGVPRSVRLSFYLGAVAFLSAVLWTIVTTKEYPPDDLEAFRRERAHAGRGARALAREVAGAIAHMPRVMRQLAIVQVATWLGLFCMWLYFSVAVATGIYGGQPGDARYQAGIEFAGVCFAFYSLVTFLFAFALPSVALRFGRRNTHMLCLSAGGLGLLAVGLIASPAWLLLSMTGVGIAWASILAMPYAMLAGALPAGRTGIYMGVFNMFIVLPEIAAALGFGTLMRVVFQNDRMAAVLAGGVCLLVAAACTRLIDRTAEA